MKTFWLEIIDRADQGTISASTHFVCNEKQRGSTSDVLHFGKKSSDSDELSDKHKRLVSWNLAVLVRLLKQSVARRQASGLNPVPVDDTYLVPADVKSVLEEVKEIIMLPKFDAAAAKNQTADEVEIGEEVVSQLSDFITRIAKIYRDNPCKCIAREHFQVYICF
jgi:hypothetical protein